MLGQARSLTSLFRTGSFAVIAPLVLGVATVSWAQNPVPPTAVQAAKMPKFAARLAHPVKRPRLPISPALTRARMHRGPLDSRDTYDNGPINGTVDAWTINLGYAVSDTFIVNSGSTVNGLSFGAWLFLGDTALTVEVSITSAAFGRKTLV